MKTSSMIAAGALAAAAGIAGAQTQTITFDGLAHGEIINTQYQLPNGVTVAAYNANKKFDLAVAFDTTRTQTADPDLEDPWTGGNLPGTTVLGNVIIIQENDIGIGDGIADRPDDEGGRPAGNILFGFDAPITEFGFDIVDLEGNLPEFSYVDFYKDGSFVGVIGFDQFVSGGAHDNGAVYGNNSINRIAPIDLVDAFGVAPDRATFFVGGSMAFDNVTFTSVPAPATAGFLGFGGLLAARRRRS